MHQTRKGNQWYFGMKVNNGVDKDSGLIHSEVVTAANVHDFTTRADSKYVTSVRAGLAPTGSMAAVIPSLCPKSHPLQAIST